MLLASSLVFVDSSMFKVKNFKRDQGAFVLSILLSIFGENKSETWLWRKHSLPFKKNCAMDYFELYSTRKGGTLEGVSGDASDGT